jgi:two-component system OmpR family response regulator
MTVASPGEWGSVPGAGLGPRLEAPLLLVEDNAALRQMLSWELSELDYQVSAASGCAQARQFIERQPLRFALIDIRLPDGDGRVLGAELAARIPGVVIVLMSGAHDLEPDPGLASHVRAFLRKPVDLHRIHQLFAATDDHPRQGARSRKSVR